MDYSKYTFDTEDVAEGAQTMGCPSKGCTRQLYGKPCHENGDQPGETQFYCKPSDGGCGFYDIPDANGKKFHMTCKGCKKQLLVRRTKNIKGTRPALTPYVCCSRDKGGCGFFSYLTNEKKRARDDDLSSSSDEEDSTENEESEPPKKKQKKNKWKSNSDKITALNERQKENQNSSK